MPGSPTPRSTTSRCTTPGSTTRDSTTPPAPRAPAPPGPHPLHRPIRSRNRPSTHRMASDGRATADGVALAGHGTAHPDRCLRAGRQLRRDRRRCRPHRPDHRSAPRPCRDARLRARGPHRGRGHHRQHHREGQPAAGHHPQRHPPALLREGPLRLRRRQHARPGLAARLPGCDGHLLRRTRCLHLRHHPRRPRPPGCGAHGGEDGRTRRHRGTRLRSAVPGGGRTAAAQAGAGASLGGARPAGGGRACARWPRRGGRAGDRRLGARPRGRHQHLGHGERCARRAGDRGPHPRSGAVFRQGGCVEVVRRGLPGAGAPPPGHVPLGGCAHAFAAHRIRARR